MLGYKQGHVVTFVSIIGRSGSGKSTIVKFVCENLDDEDMSHALINLRKGKTVFGCANLILAELGEPSLKSAQGMNLTIEKISNAIEFHLRRKKNKKSNNKQQLFVLVLDEFDVLFYDKRGKPSDFIYKLLVMAEKLREKGYLLCIIAISNNVIADYEIDDRVKSRIGTSEVFFEPYTRQDVLEILKDRAAKAFSQPIDSTILRYCADQSSDEHGDARRAIDLLRVAAEIAGRRGEKISNKHVDTALEKLQKDRVRIMLSSAPYHLKLTAAALARISYLTQETWHSTSTLYNQYRHITAKETHPLTYRRISELLTELENMGLVISQTSSKGRQGYGTQYKLVVPPEVIGKVCSASDEWWNNIVERKKKHDRDVESQSRLLITRGNKKKKKNSPTLFTDRLDSLFNSIKNDDWKEVVGLE